MVSDWTGKAGAYANSFGVLCAGVAPAVFDALGPVDGRSLTDIGAGIGTFAAQAQDHGWVAKAVEPDASMRDLGCHLHRDLLFLEGFLPDGIPQAAMADVVTALFVLNHVSDPHQAARGLARTAKPGGTVVATIWPSGPDAPHCDHYDLWARMFADSGATPLPETAQPNDFPQTQAGLANLLENAGLESITTCYTEWTFRVSSEALWAAIEAGVAKVGARYLSQTPVIQQKCQAAFSTRYRDGDDLLFHEVAIMGIGRKPDSG
jgi:ubiquinone/menaquinone biosynthesis C-methylase UbiE